MLMTLMYHRVRASHLPDPAVYLRRHLETLKAACPIRVPGESLEKNRLNLCLTFDDAYYDFYQDVFPLLQELEIKAVLAIPSHLIAEKVDLSPDERIQLSYHDHFDPEIKNNPALCSWEEIRELCDSGWVIPASHTASHQPLSSPSFDFNREIIESKALIQEKTGQAVNSLIYPYGNINRERHQQALAHYDYTMRIGSALNKDWKNQQSLLYRVDADHYWPLSKNPASLRSIIFHGLRYCSNRLRGK